MPRQRFNWVFLCWWIIFPSIVSAAPTTIVFWHSLTGDLGDTLVRMTQQFNDSQTDYRVKPIYKGDYMESLTSFAAAFRAKHPPNLVQVAEVGTSVMCSTKGVVKPYERLMQEQDMPISKARFFSAVLQHYSVQGVLMAMPFNVSVPVIFYNADVLKSFGVSTQTFPNTWDGLEMLAKRLHDAGFPCVYTSAYPAWILIESFQALHDLPLLGESSVHLQRLRRWQMLHYFEYGGRADDPTVLFTSGRCPLFSQSSGGYVGLSKTLSFHVGVAPMPLDIRISKRRHPNVVGGAALWIVAGQSKTMEHGIALFLAFLSQPKIQQMWFEQTGYLPLNPEALHKRSPILDIAALDLAGERASLLSPGGAENQIRTIHDQMLEAIFSGMTSVDKAMHRAIIRIQHALERFRRNTHTENPR